MSLLSPQSKQTSGTGPLLLGAADSPKMYKQPLDVSREAFAGAHARNLTEAMLTPLHSPAARRKHPFWEADLRQDARTILGLDDSWLHLVQVFFDAHLFVCNHLLLLVQLFLNFLAHDLERKDGSALGKHGLICRVNPRTTPLALPRLPPSPHRLPFLKQKQHLFLFGLLLVLHHLFQLVVGCCILYLQLLALYP